MMGGNVRTVDLVLMEYVVMDEQEVGMVMYSVLLVMVYCMLDVDGLLKMHYLN